MTIESVRGFDRRGANFVRRRAERVDCCCTLVATLDHALADPHFRARGNFAHQTQMRAGEVLPALPVPVIDAFRAPPDEIGSAPVLGEGIGDKSG